MSTVDTRPAVVAEQATGPLDALAHAVDVRAVGERTGRYHPRHLASWLFTTTTFPLAEGTPRERPGLGDDLRFAVEALGSRRGLRARRPAGDRRPFIDRIPEQHFAADPARWFGAEGGFAVRLSGLDAAVALPPGPAPGASRAASDQPASRRIARGGSTIELVDRPARGWRGPVSVELGLASVSGGPDAWRINPGASVAPRAGVDLAAAGVVGAFSSPDPDPGGARVAVLRLSTPDGAGRHFPGATLAVAGGGPTAVVVAPDSALAQEGFLAGALHVQVPPVQVNGEWIALLGLDGSLYASADAAGPLDHPAEDGRRRLAASALVTTGPGAAWPPAPARSEPEMVNRAPAPGRGPVVLHGLRVVRRAGGGPSDVGGSARSALTFALQVERAGGAAFRPFQRLSWTGPDPAGGTWEPVDDTGQGLPASGLADRYAQIARLAHEHAGGSAVAVRLESSATDAVGCPGEVAWSSDDGRTVLVHLPELRTDPDPGLPGWPVGPSMSRASEPVRIGADGSTWASGSTALRRMSLGDVAPLAGPPALRRRRVHGRVLCGWDNEDPAATPPLLVSATLPGRLDVDVAHGLFALSATDPPRSWPAGPAGSPPPPATVTVGYEDGATMHLGALPAAREPVLDRRLLRPTRLVCGGGVLHRDAPPDWHEIPRYATLTEALAAVSDAWSALAGDLTGTVQQEIVQVEDDATYPAETPRWPRGPLDPAAAATASLRLTLQAAERRRPHLLIDAGAGWADPAEPVTYDELAVVGLAVGGEGWSGPRLPPARRVSLQLTTVLHAENTIESTVPPQGGDVTVWRCQTAGLRLTGPGSLAVADSIVDAGGAPAVSAETGRVELTRVSVGGPVTARELSADSVIFDDDVEVQDRFVGCVRYSRVTATSVLPQVHRVAVDVPLRLLSRNRRDPGWWRLREDCDRAVVAGAPDGGELGAFGSAQLSARLAGFRQRLEEFTPAGLAVGVIRIG